MNPQNPQGYRFKLGQLIAGTAEADHLPVTAPILAQYLTGYVPADDDTEGNVYMTSADLVYIMEDVGQFTTPDIALVMNYLGYHLSAGAERGPAWVMYAIRSSDLTQ